MLVFFYISGITYYYILFSMFKFTEYNSTDQSMYAIPAEENANVKDMLCYVFFILIWREIALYMKI